MSRGKRVLFLALGIGVALTLVLGRLGAGALIQVLWFDSVGYAPVFWKRFLSSLGLRLGVAAVAGTLVFLNLRAIARTMGRLHIRRKFGNLEFVEQLPPSYLFWILLGSAGLLGVWFGFSIPSEGGVRVLLYLAAGPWGVVDPVLGHDVGFYVFLLPLLQSITLFVLVLSFLLMALAVAGYLATGALAVEAGRFKSDPVAFRHLSLLLGTFLVGMAGQMWLGRYGLLLDGSGVEGMFGYTDYHARMPALTALSLVTLLSAAIVLWAGYAGRKIVAVAALGVLVVGGVGLGQAFPALVQRLQVEPNELERETPFIEMGLEATREGFGLSELQRFAFDFNEETPLDWEEGARVGSGLPMWTPEALLVAYNSIEARFRYYSFNDITVDRYPSANGVVPVALSVREIETGGIENPTWQNLHLRPRFIRGAGAVVASATSATREGRPRMFLQSIPPEPTTEPDSPADLSLTRPDIFFGSAQSEYAVVTPGPTQLLNPQGEPGTLGIDFPRGIRMGSRLLRFALAWAYQDPNLLFSTEINRESQFVVRRAVLERVREIAPFLRYTEPPQAVIHEGRIIWIVDGFTTSRSVPLSSAFGFGFRREVNYIRGSVKITVDAVTGDVRFYRIDERDPLLDAYATVFPGLFRGVDELPDGLLSHLRYPTSLMSLQAYVLQSYHQETAIEFHGQQDQWATPTETGKGTSSVPYRPDYSWYPLPGQSDPEFLLSTVFVPAGRQNLTGLLVARCDPGKYGELQLYEFSVQDQVPGPRQVEALIEQDPALSQQFSLWRQGGSEVWTGHLQVVPLGDRVLYVEPVFLAAEADAIPELRRYVVSDGSRVAMEESLAQAFSTLAIGTTFTTDSRERGERRELPEEALQLLDSADARLRSGDWAGFGQALGQLRALLEQMSRGEGTVP